MSKTTKAAENIKDSISNIKALIEPLTEFVLYLIGASTEKLSEELQDKKSAASGFLHILQQIRQHRQFYFGDDVDLLKPVLFKRLDSLCILIEMADRGTTNTVDPLRLRMINDIPVVVKNLTQRVSELEKLLNLTCWPNYDTLLTKEQMDKFYAVAYSRLLHTAKWVRLPETASSDWCEIVRWYRDAQNDDVFWLEVRLTDKDPRTTTVMCSPVMQFK